MLRTNYKDEVLSLGETYRKYNIVGEDGRTVQSNVHLEKAYVPTQEGDTYGAGDINLTNETVNGLAPANMLINGDFQCWQRGETLTLSANQYGCDMWKASANCTIQKVADGLEIVSGTNVTLSQKVDTSGIGRQLTKVQSVNGIVTSEKIQAISNQTEITIKGLNTGDIVNYADLFIGDIVYPHVREDYSIALSRCRQYLQCYEREKLVCLTQMYTSNRETNGQFNYPVPFKSRPTIKIIKIGCIAVGGDIWRNVSIGNNEVGYVQFKIETKNTDSNIHRYMYAQFIATCEPL